MDARIRDGYHPATHTGAQADAVARLVGDITTFRATHGLDRVVVVNVASTEPPVPDVPEHSSLALLEEALADPARAVLPPSSLMAYAALKAGCAFVDFTPSPGVRLPVLHELAVAEGLPYAGSDGKTGETLLRTVLAPMFTSRALRVRSWAGTNLLGGGDGANLGDPSQARGKLESKARGLAALLGEGVTAPLHIDNVPDLGEHKTAWDHVSFEGFLGARMTLQFTWTGLDSSLAAPLILDLARLMSAAHAAGQSGPLAALAFFFKDPVATDEHRFAQQTEMLTNWARDLVMKAYLQLVRAPAALTVLGDTVAGAAAAGKPLRGRRLLLPLSSVSFYWAGMALNDWADRELDATERPERPIPSGRVSPGQALAVAGGLTAAGLGLARAAGGRDTIAVSLAAAVWAYDTVLKNTPAGPVAMATCRALDVLMGAGPIRGKRLPAPSPWAATPSA